MDDEASDEDDDEGLAASETESAGVFNASSGTDLSASDRTSTVSRRSPAKRVMAKSFVCSFSRDALRCKLRKSA